MDAFNQIFYMIDTLEPESIYYYATMKLLANLQAVKYMTVTEAAELCNISQSTMSKLIRKLGFDSYSTFKVAIAESLSLQEPPIIKARNLELGQLLETYIRTFQEDMLQAISPLELQQVQAAAAALYRASHVALFSFSAYPMLSLACALLKDGKKISVARTKRDEMDFVRSGVKNYAVLFLTQGPSEWPKKKPAIEKAKAAGAPIIAICSQAGFDGDGMVDHVLAYSRRDNILNNFSTNFYMNLLASFYEEIRISSKKSQLIPPTE